MNIHNRSILNEYRQNHHIYEQLEIKAFALLENELKQSGIMVFQLSHKISCSAIDQLQPLDYVTVHPRNV